MGKTFLVGVSIASFLFVYFCTTFPLVSLAAVAVTNRSVSCTLVEPMEGPVPDPYNCNQFFVCRAADNTSYTLPELSACPRGFNNHSLYYDFRSCSCEHNNTVCFDPSLGHGNAEFFHCATVYNPNPTTTTATTAK